MTLRLQGNLSIIKDKPCFTHPPVMHLHLCHRLTSAPAPSKQDGTEFEWEAIDWPGHLVCFIYIYIYT